MKIDQDSPIKPENEKDRLKIEKSRINRQITRGSFNRTFVIMAIVMILYNVLLWPDKPKKFDWLLTNMLWGIPLLFLTYETYFICKLGKRIKGIDSLIKSLESKESD
jgi:ABC-type polysaccharide/polyol phosphate export permease